MFRLILFFLIFLFSFSCQNTKNDNKISDLNIGKFDKQSSIKINKIWIKDEIFKILDQELQDSLCKCYTGRMSRLINCLNGFDSIVNIQISDAEQIGQIISITKESMTEYNTVKHKELVYKELHDRGYTDDVINEWIQYIE